MGWVWAEFGFEYRSQLIRKGVASQGSQARGGWPGTEGGGGSRTISIATPQRQPRPRPRLRWRRKAPYESFKVHEKLSWDLLFSFTQQRYQGKKRMCRDPKENKMSRLVEIWLLIWELSLSLQPIRSWGTQSRLFFCTPCLENPHLGSSYYKATQALFYSLIYVCICQKSNSKIPP